MTTRQSALIGAGLALLLLLIGGWWVGGTRAGAYEDDAQRWLAEDRAQVLDAVQSELPTPYDATLCLDLGKRLATIEEASDNLPTVDAGPLGILRPGLREAEADAERLRDESAAFLGEARSTYEQLVTDCAWNIEIEDEAAAETCAETSYGEACDAAMNAWAATQADRGKEQRKESGAELKSAILDVQPDLAEDAALAKEPLSREAFFAAVGNWMLAELRESRAGFENLD